MLGNNVTLVKSAGMSWAAAVNGSPRTSVAISRMMNTGESYKESAANFTESAADSLFQKRIYFTK